MSPSDQRLMYHYVRNCGLDVGYLALGAYSVKAWEFEAATIEEIVGYIDRKKRETIGGAEGQHWNRVGLEVQKWGTGPRDRSHHQLFLVPHAQAGEDWQLQPNLDPAYATGDIGIYAYAVPPRERQDTGQGRSRGN